MSDKKLIVLSNPPERALAGAVIEGTWFDEWEHVLQQDKGNKLSQIYANQRDQFYWPGITRLMTDAAQEIKNKIDRDILDSLCLPKNIIWKA